MELSVGASRGEAFLMTLDGAASIINLILTIFILEIKVSLCWVWPNLSVLRTCQKRRFVVAE